MIYTTLTSPLIDLIGQQLYIQPQGMHSFQGAFQDFSFVQESKQTERSHAWLYLRLQSDGRITEAALQQDG